MHKIYEELCALAATGQITGDAMKVLDQHVKDCPACRAFLDDLVSLKAHVTPVVAGSRTQFLSPPEGIRERFLQRATGAGLDLHPGLPVEFTDPPKLPIRPEPTGLSETLRAFRNRILDWYDAAPRFAAPLAVGLLCGVLGFVVAQHQPASVPTQATMELKVPTTAAAETQSQLANLQTENAAAHQRLTALSGELARTQAEKRQFEQQLARLAQRAAAGEQFEQSFKEVSAKLQEADTKTTRLQGEIEEERSRVATADAISLAQQNATQEAHERIASLQAQLDHARELDSGKTLAGDLISARNLHIVDVYDTQSNGERRRAFGRVFFVEGKSLVFYAYDLPGSKRPNKKVEFQVWGEQAGLGTVSVNLGAMQTDNSSQGRWMLTCDDPKVLNKINAVYITTDPNARPDSQPRGGKLMYAFLGSPNHP